MPLEPETKNRILEVAREHFLRLGFGKVTMSEIATELGMSKKTLYEYFPSKEDLLSEVMTSMQETVTNNITNIVNDSTLDFIQKLRLVMAQGAMFHTNFTNQFWVDMQKNAPTVWKGCDQFRIERMKMNTTMIVREGIEQGYFRNDVNEQITVLIYLAAVQNLMTPEMLTQLPVTMHQLFETIIKVIFEGIMTDEARAKQLSTLIQQPSN